MDPEISKRLHEQIFQTYNQLKTVLPKGILKMQVLKNQRYPIIKPSLMKEIERDLINKNKNYLSSSQKINIFYNENPFKKRTIPNLFKKAKANVVKKEDEQSKAHEKSDRLLTNSNKNISLYDNSDIITYKNFREKNMKMLGVKCDFKMKRNRGMYNSFSVNDIDMKKNIYLPRIIDRMKYSVPRNLRNNQGLIILGNNVKNIVDRNKDITFINKKNREPTDLFFYKLSKINKIYNNKNYKNNMYIIDNNYVKNNHFKNINIHINDSSTDKLEEI